METVFSGWISGDYNGEMNPDGNSKGTKYKWSETIKEQKTYFPQ